MQRMMEIVPQHIHDRSGIFMGSYDEVQKVIDLHAKAAEAAKAVEAK
jgi:fructose-1,6-bisphosphatase I